MVTNIFKFLCFALIGIIFFGCSQKNMQFDAQGNFEVDEIDIASQVNGEIIRILKEEGNSIKIGDTLAIIDTRDLQIQQGQIYTNISSVDDKLIDLQPQIKVLEKQLDVQKQQLSNLKNEELRYQRLVNNDAIPKKQLDDIKYQINVLNEQINVTQNQLKLQTSTTTIQNKTILTQKKILNENLKYNNHQISKGIIKSPINGVLLSKFLQEGEFASIGKPIFSLASMENLSLKIYISTSQLPEIRLGQKVSVFVDNAKGDYDTYKGLISWISNQSEFTPKTIQTKEERENLVYAVKVLVKNNGNIKIGMFGQVKFDTISK